MESESVRNQGFLIVLGHRDQGLFVTVTEKSLTLVNLAAGKK